MLNFYLTGLDSSKQVEMLLMFIQPYNWFVCRQIGGQPYTDTSPSKVIKISMFSLQTASIKSNLLT